MRVEWKDFMKKAAPSSWLPGYPMSEDERRHRIWLDDLAARHDSAEAEARPATSSGTAMSAKPYRVDYGGGVLQSGTEEMQQALHSPTADFVANLGSRVREGKWDEIGGTAWGALNEIGQGWGGYRGVKSSPKPVGLLAKAPRPRSVQVNQIPLKLAPKRVRSKPGRRTYDWKADTHFEVNSILQAAHEHPETVGAAMSHNKTIRNLDTLRQADPAAYEYVIGVMRQSFMPREFTFKYNDGGGYHAEREPQADAFLGKVINRILTSRRAEDFGRRAPVFMNGQPGSFTAEDVSAVRQYLKEQLAAGNMGVGNVARMGRIIDEMPIVFTQRPSDALEHHMFSPDKVHLVPHKSEDGRWYVDGLGAQHEFGHAYDIGRFGVPYTLGMLASAPFKGLSGQFMLGREVRANMAGGIGKWTPWLDTYRASVAASNNDLERLRRLYRKYSPAPPRLPE